jgi:hypothetical protein
MIVKCLSIFRLLCLLIVIFQDCVASLPFSDDVAPGTEVQERSNVTEQTTISIKASHSELLQKNESEIDLRAALCTWYVWDSDVIIVSSLLPFTAFYLLLLVFQIRLTSSPMTCYILYCQTVMYVIAIDRSPPLERVIPQLQRDNSFLLNLNLFLYGPWDLDFIRYILPPFCVASSPNLKHKALLGYMSILYPLFLIFLTWVCIELHGRNFKPIVYLFVPFRKCLGRLKQDWGEKRDVVDLFSAFFLLSYSRLMYQASVFLEYGKVTHINSHAW